MFRECSFSWLLITDRIIVACSFRVQPQNRFLEQSIRYLLNSYLCQPTILQVHRRPKWPSRSTWPWFFSIYNTVFPAFRADDETVTVDELRQLKFQFQDDVPVHAAVVDQGEVSYFSLDYVMVPDIRYAWFVADYFDVRAYSVIRNRIFGAKR